MRNIGFKMAALMTALMSIMTVYAKSQDVGGRVINENTNKTEAIIFGYRDLATNNPARRTFILDLTWKFNEAHSKYRGKGAGEKQKARM